MLTDIRSRADADAAIDDHREGAAAPGRSRRADLPARAAGRRDALGHRWRARHRAHRTRAHHARFRPAPGRQIALVTFYSDTLRLASLTRLDWQQELTPGHPEGRARAALPAAPAARDARDRRGRSVPALASQDPRPGAHLGVPAHRRTVRTLGAARPLGAAARLPRSRHAGRARLSRTCACR